MFATTGAQGHLASRNTLQNLRYPPPCVTRRCVARKASQDDRQADLLRKAAALRRQQQQVERDLQELYEGLGSLSDADKAAILEALAETAPSSQPPLAAEDSSSPLAGAGTSGTDAAAVLRRVLEEAGAWDPELLSKAAAALPRSLPPTPDGARHEEDEEYVDGDDDEFEVGAGVEEFARIIEEGGRLPPMPPEELVCEPEPAEQFLARIQASIDAYEGVPAGGAAKQAKGKQRPGLPEGAGDEPDEDWTGPFHKIPLIPEDILGTIPAPEPPQEIMEQYYHMERILLVLRRAFLTGDPEEWVSSLQSKGLLSQDLVFADPWVGLEGVPELRRYMRQLKGARATFELSKAIARCEEYDPIPKWQIIIDAWLHLPIPLWYSSYLWLHPEEHGLWGAYSAAEDWGQQGQQGQQQGQQQEGQGESWRAGLAWGRDPGQAERQALYQAHRLVEPGDWLVGAGEHGEAPGRLYPRARPPVPSAGQQAGSAHLRWFPPPTSPPCPPPRLLWIPNPLSQLVLEAEAEEERQQRWARQGRAADRGEEEDVSCWWASDEGEDSSGDQESSGDAWAEDEEGDWGPGLEVVSCPEGSRGARFERFPTACSSSSTRQAQPGPKRGPQQQRQQGQQSGEQPDYSRLVPWLLLEQDWAGQVARQAATAAPATEGQQEQQQHEGSPSAAASGRRSSGGGSIDTGISIDKDMQAPLSSAEAERILRAIYEDNFDAVMAQMPSRERRRGKAATEEAQAPGSLYKQGRCLTFTLTFGVALDTIRGEVESVCCTWGAVRGVVPSPRDAFEIYQTQAGLNPLPPGRHALREALETATEE